MICAAFTFQFPYYYGLYGALFVCGSGEFEPLGDKFYNLTTKQHVTCLKSLAVSDGFVEEWFMLVHGTFFQIILVVEVCTVRQVKTLHRAPAPVRVLHSVRCVCAAFTTAWA